MHSINGRLNIITTNAATMRLKYPKDAEAAQMMKDVDEAARGIAGALVRVSVV